MRIGVGLPGVASDTGPATLLEWARRAERRGFSSLGLIDRIVFDNYEPLVALAAAAAVTERIELITCVLIGPYRLNTALLAKQVATLDRLSGGRLTLGVGIGARTDDYVVSGTEPTGRGRRLERQIDQLRRVWRGEITGFAGPVGPATTRHGGPQILLAGHVPAALRRAARLGEGWIMGGGEPVQFRDMLDELRSAWRACGRAGAPRTAALAYFSLGSDASAQAEHYLRRYYDFPLDAGDRALVEGEAESLAAVTLRSTALDAQTVVGVVDAWQAVDCDELILLPCGADPDQVDLLADALGGRLSRAVPAGPA